jgi:hypothetical protein
MFPRINTEKIHIAICGTQNLKSSKRDARSTCVVLSRLGFKNIIVTDSDPEYFKELKDTEIITDLRELELKFLSYKNKRIDLIMNISAHGYMGNYFYFNSEKVGKIRMREWFRGLESDNNQILVLIDTCHSENMVGFQKPGIGSVTAIAGCLQRECLMEDISDKFGYGGGLTCAFLDFVDGKREFSLKEFSQYCSFRLSKLGATTVITSAMSKGDDDDFFTD